METLHIEELSPEENMRRDEEALLTLEKGELQEGIFRFYRWDRVCLSLGHFQKEKRVSGIPVVRRPTGGGALLHGWDISFAIADIRERWGTKPSLIYASVSSILRETFRRLGVEVKIERFRGRYLDRFFCFWVPTLGELSINGRKVVSMAMRTAKRSFLLHGSVYTSFDYGTASRLLGIPEEFLRKRIVSLKELDIEERDFLDVFSSLLVAERGLRV